AGNMSEHGMPLHAFVRIGRFNRPTVLIDPCKLALSKNDRIGTPLRQKATMRTCFAASAQCTALAALDQPGNRFPVALIVRRVFGSLSNVQSPFDRIFQQAMPVNGTAMIDQGQIGLAFCGSKSTSSHLPE